MLAWIAQLSTVFVLICGPWIAWADECPGLLSRLKTSYLEGMSLCQVYTRYQSALKKLEEKGLKPAERVGNLLAPRFINRPDWVKGRTILPQSAWSIYKPAPLTWSQWELGASAIEAEVRQTLSLQRFRQVDMNWLKAIHTASMRGLISSLGHIRNYSHFGLALDSSWSLSRQQAKGLRDVVEDLVKVNSPVQIQFYATQCLEERSPEFQSKYKADKSNGGGYKLEDWPNMPSNHFYTGADGIERQCGYIVYPEFQVVESQLALWVDSINAVTAKWNLGRGHDTDPILVAARAQRWFILVHPFARGNGRTSRLIMDWLLKGLGLPAPILKDMNEDLYHTEERWAEQIGEGIMRAIHEAEACVSEPKNIGCAVVESPDLEMN